MTTNGNELAAYFHQIGAMKALQGRVLAEIQTVLGERAGRLSQALGAKINVDSASRDIGPKLAQNFDEEAWIGLSMDVEGRPRVDRFDFGLYICPAESDSEEIEVYAYGAFGVDNKEHRELLWQVIESSPHWNGERDRPNWSDEIYQPVVRGTEDVGIELRAVIDRWCETWKGLGGVCEQVEVRAGFDVIIPDLIELPARSIRIFRSVTFLSNCLDRPASCSSQPGGPGSSS